MAATSDLRMDLSVYPNPIRNINAAYESQSGLSIKFTEVALVGDSPSSPGRLFFEGTQAIIEHKIHISPQRLFETICHEMFHLELCLQGYPLLASLENDRDARQLVAHVESLAQHPLVFEKEQALGYDPYTFESAVATEAYNVISTAPTFGPSNDHLWQFMYSLWATAYARARVLCKETSTLNRLDALFKKTELTFAAGIATQLSRVITKEALSSANDYTQTMRSIIDRIILGNQIANTHRIILNQPIFP